MLQDLDLYLMDEGDLVIEIQRLYFKSDSEIYYIVDEFDAILDENAV